MHIPIKKQIKTEENKKQIKTQRLHAGPVFKQTNNLRLKDYFISNKEQRESGQLTLEDLDITEDGYRKETM